MRLIHSAIRPAADAVGITFDGRPISALPGESVAASLSAAGVLAMRQTAGGAPRGLYCGMGACFDCLVTIDGVANQRACLAKVRAGMVVASRAPLVAPARSAGGPATAEAPDLLVVGAGPAGLAAAIAAAEAGARVTMLDEREAAGGQYLKPLADSHAHAAPDRQFRQAAAMRARAAAAGVVHHAGALVWGGFAVDEVAALVGGRPFLFRPRRLLLAAGAHERPMPMPGWTLPGVMTTGSLQTLARAYRVSPGQRVLIAGNGPLNLQLAAELIEGGIKVVAVLEAAPKPGFGSWRAALSLAANAPDLAWDGARYLATLRRAGVPLRWGTQPIAAEGDAQFTALHARTPAGEARFAADVLAMNLGFQSETGLARALGAAHRFRDEGLGRLETITDAEGRTSLPGLFAVGDGAAIGGARIALARGRLAGLAAARELGFATPEEPATHRALARAIAFQSALWRLFQVPEVDVTALPDAVTICRCEEVSAGTLRAAIAGGAASLPALKKATRAGMGRCQGRMCAGSVARFAGGRTEGDFAAPRAPLKPVPAIAIAAEQPEWQGGPSATPPPGLPPAPPVTRTEAAEALIVGGGVMGLAVAAALAAEGLGVVLLERGEVGQGASTGNAGSLHVQLHAYDSDGAAAAPESAAAEVLRLGPRAIALWRAIAAEAGEGLGIRTEGGLMLVETAADLAALDAKVAMERAFGVASHLLGGFELYSRAPWLGAGFAGAAFCPEEGQMDPLRGLVALRARAIRAGAVLREGVALCDVRREGAGFLAIGSDGVAIRAGRLVNAAGPWAGEVAARLGVPIPARAAVQQVLVTEAAPGEILRPLILHATRHLSLKQGDLGHLVLGGAWPGVLDAAGRPRNLRASIEGNLHVAQRVLPGLAGLQLIRAWTGLNVQVPGPILGADPRCPGLFHAVTYNGWTLAPAAAELIAAAARGETTPRAFVPAR
jgi:glycine/D-amino acid oxidase-like deaminating enzyme/bacterioferritin-associated ferredoxin